MSRNNKKEIVYAKRDIAKDITPQATGSSKQAENTSEQKSSEDETFVLTEEKSTEQTSSKQSTPEESHCLMDVPQEEKVTETLEEAETV